MTRYLRLAIDNDNVVYLRGVVDEADPVNADGSPKWVNDATVTWYLLTGGGALLGTGNAVALNNGGAYRIDLAENLAYLSAATLRVVVTLTNGKSADFSAGVEAFYRTGSTVLL